ncbi:RDD family protein [Streptomyces sp. NPDC050636]|uniref:RDD family protein n=1 Tax=Streptomyces sp. NPDC050636 TaxID=3154510 RepID=UPI003412BDF4
MTGFPPPHGEFGAAPSPYYPYPPQASGPSEQMLANQGARLGARLLDVFFMFVLMFHEPFMNWKFGGTFGKQICGLRVARLEDGQNISLGRAFGRFLVVIPMGFVSILPLLNLLWCCWDQPFRQCLHDKAATTVVVKRAPAPAHPKAPTL